MVRQKGNLTHHEELRLDYLRKNYHYLNGQEQQELDYLEQKAQGLIRSSRKRSRAPQSSSNNSIRRAASSASAASFEDDEEELLPAYPRKERRRRQDRQDRQDRPLKKERKSEEAKVKKPRKKGRIKRFFQLLLLLLVLVIGGMIFMFVKGLNSTDTDPVAAKAAQTEAFHGEDTTDGVNILVLGTDGRVGETSDMTRTDSIMVVNINNKDKKIKMVSFMRDTLIDIDGYDYKLNVAYTFGEQNNNQGAENVRQVLKENFDINIKHYALVDFSTFVTAIDTLFPEGVTIDAQFSTIDGQEVTAVDVPDDLNMENGVVPDQTIHIGRQQMDGRTLLNYARFRKDDEGDFGRTKRQQQVIAAIMTQIKDPTKLFTGSEAIGKIFSLTSTSIPYSFILTNGLSAVLDGANGVETTTIPENGDWVEEYDVYGGDGLKIDFEKYKERLSALGFR